jgi:hypothetical protein
MKKSNFLAITATIASLFAGQAQATENIFNTDIYESRSGFDIVEKSILGVAGYYSGLIIHEVGHISSVEYLGGNFDKFAGPYGSLGEPTLWMDGNGLQYGAAAMMGNNFSNMTSSYMLNKYNPTTAYEDGILLFSILNPILYSLGGDDATDFKTASTGLGYTEEDLKMINLVPSLNLAIKAMTNGSADYYGKHKLNLALNGRYLKVTNTGPIYALQKYSYISNEKFSNIGLGIRSPDYSIEYGKYKNDELPISKYIGVEREFKINPTSRASVKAMVTEDKEKILEIEYSNDYAFLNYSTLSDDLIMGLSIEF